MKFQPTVAFRNVFSMLVFGNKFVPHVSRTDVREDKLEKR